MCIVCCFISKIESHVINDYVRCLVERFSPHAVVLFGSQAKGTVTHDSDVDVLVVMDHDKKRNVEQEIEIDCATDETSFVQEEILKKGRVLYECY